MPPATRKIARQHSKSVRRTVPRRNIAMSCIRLLSDIKRGSGKPDRCDNMSQRRARLSPYNFSSY